MLRLTNHGIDYIQSFQTNVYTRLNNIAEDRPMQACLWSIPISVLDIGSEIIKNPLWVIDALGLAAIEMFGALLGSQHTLNKSVQLLERATIILIAIPVQLVFAPIKITFQVVAIIRNPTDVEPFSSKNFRQIRSCA